MSYGASAAPLSRPFFANNMTTSAASFARRISRSSDTSARAPGAQSWDGETVPDVIPERDFELGAGFGKAEEGVAAVTTDVAAGTGADLLPGHLAADVVF